MSVVYLPNPSAYRAGIEHGAATAWSPLKKLFCFVGCAGAAWGIILLPAWIALAT